ncbi:MAG TPA: Asp-tRNA(Asn)/Glu-tRNA(Gln) amidotransferase subunit GatA [bacterium]|nr:Asp-tRNA(Asn)/Glu-tRNA(Gln) amidotransferase subunit GatA [bacterium]
MKERVWDLPARELRRRVVAREISAEECVRGFLDRLAAVEPSVGAFLSVAGDQALADARGLDGRMAGLDPESVPLCGVPVAIKDNIVTEGLETTCGSKILKGFIPPYDATCVAKLRSAGAIVIGKTNCDEFGMGSSTENSAFQRTRNPWDLGRVPGGSSGGSAAAVAAREVPVALGTDTGGSVRQPAAFCGIVGLKPTYGRVSRYGLVAFASSLDQVGTLAADVTDCALLASVICGRDPRDTTSVEAEPFRPDSVDTPASSKPTIGLPKEFLDEGVDGDVRYAIEMAAHFYETHGFSLRTITLPHTRYGVAAYYLIADAEASSNLARYDGVRYGYRSPLGKTTDALYSTTRGEGFGEEVKRRIMLGTYALSAGYYDQYYLKALRVRTLIAADFHEAFRQVDVLLTPTAPAPAFSLGEKVRDPLVMYLSDVFTITPSLAGLPAVSLPCGTSGEGLPIGMQLVARPFAEGLLLQTARAFEKETPWHEMRPGSEGLLAAGGGGKGD